MMYRFSFLLCLLIGCQSEPRIDLSSHGMPLTIATREKITLDSDPITQDVILKGNSFQLRIGNGNLDLGDYKKRLEANELNRVKQFIVETDNTLLYESELMNTSEFHFVKNIETPQGLFHCKEDEILESFSREAIEMMLEVCQTVEAK